MEYSSFLGKWYIDEEGNTSLHLVLEASRNEDRILPYEIKAYNGVMQSFSAEEKELVKATYLRALRDADFDLTAKKNSRVSQILLGHELFQKGGTGKEEFEKIIAKANEDIKNWFKNDDGEESNKKQIKDVIDTFIKSFLIDSYESELSISEANIKSIS